MKPFFFLFTVIFVLAFLSGCKENKSGIVIPEKVEKYPTALNTEWEYETTTYIAKYDKNGNLGMDSLAWPTSYSVVRITSVNDSVYGEKNLIRFDFGSNQEYSTGTHWYRNSERTFEMIAYSGLERDWVTPIKRKSNKLAFLKYLSNNLLPNGALFSTKDSTYLFKKTVLEYPLTVGNSWDIYIAKDFLITKTIVEKKQLLFNGKSIECFDIKSIYNSAQDLDIHDYISLDYGLVKRETIADSMEVTTTEFPNGTGEFLRYKSTSNLIRKSN